LSTGSGNGNGGRGFGRSDSVDGKKAGQGPDRCRQEAAWAPDGHGRHKHLARNTLASAAAAARRLQVTAENAADSYARSMKKAAEEKPPAKPAKNKPAKKKKA
jgi:hypothetical protein